MVRLTPQGLRVLGCLIEKQLATPDHYPLSANALRTACNQSTGRDPVVAYTDVDVRAGLDDLKAHQLMRSEYARSSRVPRSAHRLEEHLSLDPAQCAVLGLLLLRGPQTAAELRTRATRMHAFTSVAQVEEVLGSLADHRFGVFVEQREREPGRRERRWAHTVGDQPATAVDAAASSDSPGPAQAYVAAIAADDWTGALAHLADRVVLHSPAADAPYRGADEVGRMLRAVADVLDEVRYHRVHEDGDRATLVFDATVGGRPLQGVDLVHLDAHNTIIEITTMIRPLAALTALADAVRTAPGAAAPSSSSMADGG